MLLLFSCRSLKEMVELNQKQLVRLETINELLTNYETQYDSALTQLEQVRDEISKLNCGSSSFKPHRVYYEYEKVCIGGPNDPLDIFVNSDSCNEIVFFTSKANRLRIDGVLLTEGIEELRMREFSAGSPYGIIDQTFSLTFGDFHSCIFVRKKFIEFN